jgi:putative membrane protein
MFELLDHDGPLGSRASLMTDVVFLAMFLVVPVMLWSIWQVKVRRRYLLHKRVQLALGLVLAAAVVLFEVHLTLHDWRGRATGTAGGELSQAAEIALVVHLCCSIPAAALWVFVIVQALRRFPSPPQPSSYSRRHKFWGWLAVIEMVLTAVTGWVFYWLAFVG